jgi:Fe-S-cluster containining protein
MAESEWPYEVEPFQCHRCGNCCRGDGFVVMTADDLARAADLLAMSTDEFLAAYCRRQPDGEIHLIDQADPLRSCIFLRPDNLCRIHAAKPAQCQGFPMKWRPPDALELCAALRHAAGLPPPTRRTISSRSG